MVRNMPASPVELRSRHDRISMKRCRVLMGLTVSVPASSSFSTANDGPPDAIEADARAACPRAA